MKTIKNQLDKLEKQVARTDDKTVPIYIRRFIAETDDFLMGTIISNGKSYDSESGELENDFLTRVNIDGYRVNNQQWSK